MKFLIFAALLIARSATAATPSVLCNFVYTDDQTPTASSFVNYHRVGRRQVWPANVVIKRGTENFDCLSSEEAKGFMAVNPIIIDTRGMFNRSEYEEENECTESTMLIAPRELNNIYNQLKKLDRTTIQQIEITRCLNPDSDCSNMQVLPPNKKIVCNQRHTRVTLKAIDDIGRVYDEIFYYPSACVCQTFKKKI